MNYEERYNAALERAKALCNDADTFTIYDITTIFPELEEEMIRKDIISYLRNEKIVKKYISDIEINKWIAWLDKQDDVNEISAEWSEKDEQMILSIEQIMNCASLLNIVPEKIDNIKSWLKSLKPHKQWTPNAAQLIVIKDLIEDKNTSNVNKVILQGMLREIDDAYL